VLPFTRRGESNCRVTRGVSPRGSCSHFFAKFSVCFFLTRVPFACILSVKNDVLDLRRFAKTSEFTIFVTSCLPRFFVQATPNPSFFSRFPPFLHPSPLSPEDRTFVSPLFPHFPHNPDVLFVVFFLVVLSPPVVLFWSLKGFLFVLADFFQLRPSPHPFYFPLV